MSDNGSNIASNLSVIFNSCKQLLVWFCAPQNLVYYNRSTHLGRNLTIKVCIITGSMKSGRDHSSCIKNPKITLLVQPVILY